MEARNVIVGRETRAYDDLHAAEVLLQVRENEVEEAKDEVAVQRRAAAEHLVTMQRALRRDPAAKAKVPRGSSTTRRQRPPGRGRARQHDQARAGPAARSGRTGSSSGSSPQARRAARTPTAATTAPPAGFLDRPVNGPVTSPFGYRIHPIYHYWGLHDGTDFGAACGAAAATPSAAAP